MPNQTTKGTLEIAHQANCKVVVGKAGSGEAAALSAETELSVDRATDSGIAMVEFTEE